MKSFKSYLHIFLVVTTFSISYAQNNNSFKPEEITEKQITTLDKDLILDDFQKLELKEFILEKTTYLKNVMDTGIDNQEIRFLIENNNREIDFKLKEVLSTEQFDKYLKLKRERAINPDQKKKKKKHLTKSSNQMHI